MVAPYSAAQNVTVVSCAYAMLPYLRAVLLNNTPQGGGTHTTQVVVVARFSNCRVKNYAIITADMGSWGWVEKRQAVR